MDFSARRLTGFYIRFKDGNGYKGIRIWKNGFEVFNRFGGSVYLFPWAKWSIK